LKLIHTSDWHVGRFLNEYSLLDDQAAFFDWFIEEMKQRKPDAILVSGDIYNRSVPPAEAVALLNRVLAQLVLTLKIPVILTAGNHDSKTRLAFGNELLEQTGLYMICEADAKRRLILKDEHGPLYLHPLPYLELHDLQRAFPEKELPTLQKGYDAMLRSIAEDFHPGERHVLMAHGFFTTGDHEDADPVGGEELVRIPIAKQFCYTALGHIHRPYPAGSDTVRYCGAPLKSAIDEEGDRYIYEVTIGKAGDPVSTEALKVPPRHELRTLSGSFEEFLSRSKTAGLPADDYYFFKLTDKLPVPDAMLQLKPYYPNLLGLSYEVYAARTEEKQKLQQFKNRSVEELMADFYEEELGETLSDTQKTLTHTLMEQVRNKQGGDRS